MQPDTPNFAKSQTDIDVNYRHPLIEKIRKFNTFQFAPAGKPKEGQRIWDPDNPAALVHVDKDMPPFLQVRVFAVPPAPEDFAAWRCHMLPYSMWIRDV